MEVKITQSLRLRVLTVLSDNKKYTKTWVALLVKQITRIKIIELNLVASHVIVRPNYGANCNFKDFL